MMGETLATFREALIDRYAWLQRILLSMTPETNVAGLLMNIAEAATDVLGGRFCVVQPYDAKIGEFLVDQFTMGGGENLKTFEFTMPRENGSARYALANGLLLIEDYDKAAETYPFLSTGSAARLGSFRDILDVKACIGIRMEASGEPIGVLFVNYATPQTFDSNQVALAQDFSSQAAIIIRTARLLESAKEASRRNLDLVILKMQGILQKALEPGDEGDFLQYVVDETLQLLGVDAGWLLLREGTLVRVVATDSEHRADVGRTLDLERSISGLCLLEKKPIAIDDLSSAPAQYREVYQPPYGSKSMRSMVAVPLIVNEQAIGVFSLESEEVASFDSVAIEMLQLLGNHIAPAVSIGRLREEAALLVSLGDRLARETDLGLVVQQVLENALMLVGAHFGQVLFRDGERLVVRYTTNVSRIDVNQVVQINDSVSGLAIIERRPVIVPDVERREYYYVEIADDTPEGRRLVSRMTQTPRYKRTLEAEKRGIRAEFAVPLVIDGRVLGVLNVETPNEHGFAEHLRHQMQALIANEQAHFAIALQQQDKVELGRILTKVLALTETEFGQIIRIDEPADFDDPKMVIVATTGMEQIGTRVRPQSITRRVVRARTPLYIEDVGKDPDYVRYLGEDMKSEMVVPLVLGDDLIGTINLESPVYNFFTSDHARILETFAVYAASAVVRAEKVEKSVLAEIGSLAGDIVHRLNNPLGAISTRLELLEGKQFYEKLLQVDPSVGLFFERLRRDINNAKTIVQELRSELRSGGLHTISLQATINAALERAELPKTISVSTKVRDTAFVLADDRLVSVFWNLLSNAGKAMSEAGTLTITAKHSSDKQWWVVTIADSGVGIEPWRLPSIFDPNETTTRNSQGPTHGLGLWWTKENIDRYGGTIDVSSTFGVGTEVTLQLHSMPPPY